MHDTGKTAASPRTLWQVGLIVATAVVAARMRLLPYELAGSSWGDYLWNFTPVLAILLFGLTYLRTPVAGYLVPFAAMAVSDLVLHVTGLAESTFWGRLGIYATFALAATPALLLRRRFSVTGLAAVTFAGSVLFFVMTNFAAWVVTPADQPPPIGYPKTLGGLLECFTLALPFFRNQIVGDAFFVTALFGAWALVEKFVPDARAESIQAEPVLVA